MFAITRRPSATTSGRCENLPSSRTSCATARVAADPLPMATPISASLSAIASLTPSPVMATTCPRLCSAATTARFCCGVTRPKTLWLLEHLRQLVEVLGQGPGVDGVDAASVTPGTPTGGRDRADGARVVAGDHLERDALLGEVAQRVGGVVADPFGEDHEAPAARGRPAAADARARRRIRPGRRRAPAPAGPARRSCPRPDAPRVRRRRSRFGQHHLRRAEHPGAVPAGARPPTTCGPTRTGSPPVARPRSVGSKRAASAPAVALASGAVGATARAPAGRRPRRQPSSSVQPVEHDVAVGERAGLVEADDVDPGQHLDRRQFLDQRLLAGQRHRGDHEREAGQQHQAFGHHADQRRDGAGDGVLPARRCPCCGTGSTAAAGRRRPSSREIQRSSVLVPPTSSDCAVVNFFASAREPRWRRRRRRPRWPGTGPYPATTIEPDRTSSPRGLGDRVGLAGEQRLVDLQAGRGGRPGRRRRPGRRCAARAGRRPRRRSTAISRDCAVADHPGAAAR